MSNDATELNCGIPELNGKHYDVGVFGMWFGENYGSVLTYYALRKALMNLGYSVLMLEKPDLGGNSDAEFNPDIHPRVFAAEEGYDLGPVLEPQEYARLNDYCDTFVVGSDQVWNYFIARYFKGLTYLSFTGEGRKRISYASSFGHGSSLTPKEALSDVAKEMNRFDAISVREASGVDIARNEFGVHATQVVDPIYLHQVSDYERIMRKPDDDQIPQSDYLLCYVLDPDAQIGATIKETAQRMGLELVVMLDGRGDLDKAKENLGISTAFRCPDARKWLYYIQHASYMITDSFHGACFSLLFHTPVAILSNKRGAARIESLVETFGIPFIFARNAEQLKRAVSNPKAIDFEMFDRTLDMERKRSYEWLREAMRMPAKDMSTVACVTQKECCGCGACYSACPVDAISMETDSEGFLYPSVNNEKCISCRKCTKACPSLNPRLEKKKEPLCFAAYGDDDIREISSSGGLFTMIARKVLDKGGCVCGAAFDENFHLKQTWAENEEELQPLRMSKYIQSDTSDTFKETKAALDAGKKVLYVGCPCQVAGLNSYLGRDYENLFTLDLLCHGGPSQGVFNRYLHEVHGDRPIDYVGFRDKDHFGWAAGTTVKYSDGEVYLRKRSDDVFQLAFLHCFTVRPHCQVCNYSRLPRQGDLTLGDFWGVGKLNKSFNDGKGTSIVSVNTDKGFRMLGELWPDLRLLETVTREHILTHGQPYGNPYKSDPRRTRFYRMIEETSMQTATESARSGVFDFAFMGAHGDSCGEILRSYALVKTLAKEDRSVMVVRRPNENNVMPYAGRYRFIDFMNENVPVLSAHKTLAGQRDLKHYVRGFVSERTLDYYQSKDITGEKKIVSYYVAGNREKMINPLFLLGVDDYRKLLRADGDERQAPKNTCIFVSGKAERDFVVQLMEKRGWKSNALNEDSSVNAWLKGVSTATCVITDDLDTSIIASILGVPVALLNAETEFLSDSERDLVQGISVSLDEVEAFVESGKVFALDGKNLAKEIERSRSSFIDRALKAMGEPVERPAEEGEKKQSPKKKAHGKAYKEISKRIPKAMKAKLKKVIK